MNESDRWHVVGRSWGATVFVYVLPFVGVAAAIWHSQVYGFQWSDIAWLVGFYFLSGLAITAGYHRCFSHVSYECSWGVQLFYALMGSTAIQKSIYDWSRNHRIHHQYSDTELDPHNINQGFLHAHMDWVGKKTSLDGNFSQVPDLTQNKIVMWQYKYYWSIALFMGVVVPLLIGWMVGRPLAVFVWGSLLRIVFQSHATYSVNSLAHMWGNRPYSLDVEARDSWAVAIISNGEGFHNFHHRFASDYRNGWRWYQWDPTKWWVLFLERMGWAWNLKAASEADIIKAQLIVDAKKVDQKIKSATSEEFAKAFFDRVVVPYRRKVEALATQMADLRKQYHQSQRRKEFRGKYREARRSLRTALKEWRVTIVSLQHLSKDQLAATAANL